MKNEIPYDLIAKFLAGECSGKETEELEQWKNSDKNNKDIFEQMKCTWQDVTPDEYNPDVEAALDKVSSRIEEQKNIPTHLTRFWIRVAAALVVGLGIFGFMKITGLKPSMQTIESLAGSKPREVILPDGSRVILNQKSKLSFPGKFKGNQRKVTFEGEAYFIITPNKKKPFVVESGSTITKVLGTEFNLNAPSKDSIVRLSVTKGLVSFNVKEKKENVEVLVKAGESGEANTQKRKIKKFINADPNFMAWKTGILVFKNQELSHAIKSISDYYHQKFELGPGLDTVIFSTTFDSLSIEQAIESLQLILDVDIAKENGVYILHQKS